MIHGIRRDFRSGALPRRQPTVDIEDLPASLAVVGAGPLGIELAAAFTRLGVRTMVFDERDSLGGLKDPEVSKAARTLLGAELDLKLQVKIEAEPYSQGAKIRWIR